MGLRRDEISITDHVAVAGLEFEAPAWSLDDLESTFVESLVMEKTQQDDIVPLGWTSVDPVFDVMTL